MLPGIESWHTLGNKSKTGESVGMEKVRQVADHVNAILRYIPYVQTNFVLGLDCDEGPEPFALTKRFIDLAPGAYPAFSLLTAYGAAAPLNLELQSTRRVIPFPFHFLDGHHAMNVRPLHYDWEEFYRRAEDLTRYALSPARVARRLIANDGMPTKSLNLVRAMSSRRARFQAKVRTLLRTDRQVRRFFDGQTEALPDFYRDKIKRSLGPLWDALPKGALTHDQNAYLKRHRATETGPLAGVIAAE
jgi:hypothetical protein